MPRPTQFSLRTLLLVITLICVLLGLAVSLSPPLLFGLGGLAIIILAHVAANAIGTRLKQEAADRISSGEGLLADHHSDKNTPVEDHFAPTTPLGQNQALGLVSLITGATGGAVGAIAACWITATYTQNRASWFILSVAAVAFGGLAGLGTFAISAFTLVVSKAFRQAVSPTPGPAQKSHLVPKSTSDP